MKRRRVKQRGNKMPILFLLLGVSVLVLLFTTFLQIRIPYKSSAQTPSFTCKVGATDYTKTVSLYCSTKPQSSKVCYPANPPFVVDCGAVRLNKVGSVCSTGNECKNNIAPTASIVWNGSPKISPTATPFSIDSLTTDVYSQAPKLYNNVSTRITYLNKTRLLLLNVFVKDYSNNSSFSLCKDKDYPKQIVGGSIPLLKNLWLITKKANDSIEFYYQYYQTRPKNLQTKYLFSIPNNLSSANINFTTSGIPNEQVVGSGKFTAFAVDFGSKYAACLVLNK